MTKARYEITLRSTISIGSAQATASVLFISGKPKIIAIEAPSTVKISDVFREIFGDSFATDIIDLSFSGFHLWYSWSETTVPLGNPVTMREGAGTVPGIFISGFHANASTSICGTLMSSPTP